MKKVRLIFCLTVALLVTGFVLWPRASALTHSQGLNPTHDSENVSLNRTYANSTGGWVTPSKDSFKYGYISANVDCREAGQPRRMKFVSQVFTYCYGAVPRDQIIEDNKVYLHQVVKTSCGENYSISYIYLNGPNDTSAQAENYRARELRESGYGKHVEWQASVDYPSSKCR